MRIRTGSAGKGLKGRDFVCLRRLQDRGFIPVPAPSSSSGKRSEAERDPGIQAGMARTCAAVQNRSPSPAVPRGSSVPAWIPWSSPWNDEGASRCSGRLEPNIERRHRRTKRLAG